MELIVARVVDVPSACDVGVTNVADDVARQRRAVEDAGAVGFRSCPRWGNTRRRFGDCCNKASHQSVTWVLQVLLML